MILKLILNSWLGGGVLLLHLPPPPTCPCAYDEWYRCDRLYLRVGWFTISNGIFTTGAQRARRCAMQESENWKAIDQSMISRQNPNRGWRKEGRTALQVSVRPSIINYHLLVKCRYSRTLLWKIVEKISYIMVSSVACSRRPVWHTYSHLFACQLCTVRQKLQK